MSRKKPYLYGLFGITLLITLFSSFCSSPDKGVRNNHRSSRLSRKDFKKQAIYRFFLKEKNLTPSMKVKWIEIYYRIKNPYEKKLLFKALSTSIHAHDIQPILLKLNHRSLKSKRRVAQFIGRIHNKALPKQLFNLLHSHNRPLNRHAGYFLQFIAPERLANMLNQSKLLLSPDPVKISILKIIGQQKSWKSLEILFNLLDTNHHNIKAYSLWAFHGIQRKHPRKVLPFLLYKLQSKDNSVIKKAAFLLGQNKNPAAILPLLYKITHSPMDLRRYLSKNLVHLTNSSTIPILVKGFEIDNPLLHKELVWLLGESRKKEAIPHLIHQLDNPNSEIRKTTILAILKFKQKNIQNYLLNKLNDPNHRVRIHAIWALANLKIRKLPPKLIQKLEDKNKNVRLFARWAILRLANTRNCKYLLKSIENMKPFSQVVIIEVFAKVRLKKAFYYLKNVLEEKGSPTLKLKAIEALARLSDPRSIMPLLMYCQSNNPKLRASATKALGYLGDKKLFLHFVKLLNDPHPLVRKEAAWALGRLKMKKGIQPLMRTLYRRNESNKHVRKAVMKALLKLKKKWNQGSKHI